MKKRVVIIGAGPAGLTAAYELIRKEGYEVIVLEESEEIGGIAKTVTYKNNRMDMGGHRFFTKSKKVMDWWTTILPIQGAPSYDDKILGRETRVEEKGPDPEKVDTVFLRRQRLSRIYFRKKFFDYPISVNGQTIKNLGIGNVLVCGLDYCKAMVFKKKETSLENFYINRFGRKLYSLFFEDYTNKLWGRHPRDISAEWGAQRVKGISIKAVLKDWWQHTFHKGNKEVETSLIREFYYPKLGPGQLWELVAKKIEENGGRILFKSKVKRFVQESNQLTKVIYEDSNGIEQTIDCDYVISSMPIKDLVEGLLEAPAKAKEIASGLPYRDYVTLGVLVNRLCMQNTTNIKTIQNQIPDCWMYIQDRGVKLGRIQIYNNWSPYMIADPDHTMWLGLEYFCAEGDELWEKTEEEFKDFAGDELISIGLIKDKKEILDVHKVRVKKAYPAYFDSYNRFNELRTYLDTISNLYCVGRNGQHHYNNMDHSMLTAFEAVNLITTGSLDKQALWNVNTEKEYHE
jgi:protoporphyrinogen oxidase